MSGKANSLLVAMVVTLMLFGVFATITKLSLLSGSSYALDYGWEKPKTAKVSTLQGNCTVPAAKRGFPILYERQANDRPADSSGRCQSSVNPLARYMDMALCFAAAAIIGVGAATAMRSIS